MTAPHVRDGLRRDGGSNRQSVDLLNDQITSGIDLLQINDFLAGSACETLRAELLEAGGGPATVSGAASAVQPLVRRVTRATMPAATRERVARLLMARKGELEHFSPCRFRPLRSRSSCAIGQATFFVAHQDGNTPLVHDDTRFRKISAIIFLSGQSEAPAPWPYGDGALVFRTALIPGRTCACLSRRRRERCSAFAPRRRTRCSP